MIEYSDFLETKRITAQPCGFEADACAMPSQMFDFQRDVTRWGLRIGRSALLLECGFGKTLQELTFADQVLAKFGGMAQIFTPLCVAQQTVREGQKFGIHVNLCREQSDMKPGINVTNYDRAERFSPDGVTCLIADESGILKHQTSKTRNRMIEFARDIPFRLGASATPAPNDFMELGNHAEFLGIMTMQEMLATFFCHDGGDTSKWRLKGHAVDEFWRWVASWAVMMRMPSDLGYPDGNFKLPPLHMVQHMVPSPTPSWALFPMEARTLQERRAARRDSLEDRVKLCADLANSSDEQWIVWCGLNDEGDALEKAIPGCVQIAGRHKAECKEAEILKFIDGQTRVVVSKGDIFGWGMNLQNCHNMALCGMGDSMEMFYQMIRRSWRFGQTHEVYAHVVTSEAEGAVVRNIERKQKQLDEMSAGMLAHMRDINEKNLRGTVRMTNTYKPVSDFWFPQDWATEERIDGWYRQSASM